MSIRKVYMVATFWALVPAIIAIALALITKQVYFSLFLGILAGALFFTGFDVIAALTTIWDIMAHAVSSNMNIVIFLVILGMIVALIQKSGASKAYANWAVKKISSKKGALGVTGLLGILIFVDDYFNCLTVGTVMRPITDKFKVSRARLAYGIDATAAPVCILAPISSWAAAVSSSLPEGSNIDGFSLFLQTIPFNFYALLTIAIVFLAIAFNFNFPHMQRIEDSNPDISIASQTSEDIKIKEDNNAHVFDLVIPVIFLIAICIFFMLFTGGIFDGKNVVEAFANANASLALVLGGFFTVIFTFILYIPRKIVTFVEFNDALVEGFKAMVSAILILTFAWTLSGVSGEGYLEAGQFVGNVLSDSSFAIGLIPALFYAIALGLSFATGTSWGTFALLIPIVVTVFGGEASSLLVISVAAVLAGAVNGDHISPISDTTILSSAGAGSDHIAHVETQLPYSMLAAIPAIIGFLIAGLTQNGWIGLVSAVAIMLAAFFILRARFNKQRALA